MRNFVNWSGFAKMEPIPAGTFVLGQGDAVDHPIMRFVIGRYANMRDIRNPLEIGSQSPPATQRVWKRDPTAEPLPSSPATVEEVVDVDAVESREEVQVSRAPETSSPAGADNTLPAAPEPIPESKPAQPLALANSPEAIAQLRAANSILKNLTKKPNKAKNPAQVQVQTNTNTRAGAQQSKPQKATTRPKTQPKASAPSQPKVSHSSSPSSPETNTAGESKVEPSPEESKKTSRLRGFMGNWF
ncbi:hypothetical protein BT96DRAFT_19167 [Gymnopus androsaceus JB14]|uniref:Uncharacterized protein n=1 Tax=Gymnopus androsaceus JB14 TaxID=1447944 RepID=A0A6A4ISU8_9AGAR|nr:hypothetical protein BT96DRAFT_19167 [Gymnopus androsaceus JB14]